MTRPVADPAHRRRSRSARSGPALVAVALLACACGSAPPAGMPGGPHRGSAAPTPVVSLPAASGAASTPTGEATGRTAPRRLTASDPVAAGGPARPLPEGAIPVPERTGTAAASQRLTFVPGRVTIRQTSRTVSAAVQRVGTGPAGELELPADVGAVGWWRGGARAGDLFGSVVLAGHIDSRERGIGVFAALLTARVGDRVTVAGGGLVQEYSVTGRRQVRKDLLVTGTDTFSHSVPGRLVLITCTGRFDRSTRHYSDNLVVIASPSGPARRA